MPRRPSRKAHTAGAPPLERNVSDLRALAHPLRLRMMELFAESAKTTKQVAEILGQPPTRLYHHVNALERAGLLVLKETRPNRGAVEKWYEGISRQVGATTKGSNSPAARAARRAIAATVLEQAKQEVLEPTPRGAEPPLVARMVVSAPPAVIPEIRQRIYDAVQGIKAEFACEDDPASDAVLSRWALTLAFAPVTAGGSAKAGELRRKAKTAKPANSL